MWTKTRARDAGYELSDVLCDLCGSADDTILHRLWRCPACDDAREEVLGRDARLAPPLDITEDTDPEQYLLYTR
eukprot:2466775-Pyramimonas_sp.AAC.1